MRDHMGAVAVVQRRDGNTNSRYNSQNETIEIGDYLDKRSRSKIQKDARTILWIKLEQLYGHVAIY